MIRSVGPVLLLTAACLVTVASRPAPGVSAGKDAKTTSDEWCGFSVAVGEPWRRAPLRDFTVPGAIRCAWSGPKEASVVVFLQEPGSAVSPRALLDQSAAIQKDKLGATVSAQELRKVSGMQAMWLV